MHRKGHYSIQSMKRGGKGGKGAFGIAKTYKPKAAAKTAKDVEAEIAETEPVEETPEEGEVGPSDLSSEEEEEEEEAEGKTKSKKGSRGKKKTTKAVAATLPVELVPISSTKARLQSIALEALEVDDVSALPDYVVKLAGTLTLDDADVFWEFASLKGDRQALEDYYVAILQELETRENKPALRGVKTIPHYHSLTFASPLLAEERKTDDERDGQLLRKDKPVRGAVFCGKCRDNLISTRQVQLRSLDEPTTIIYTCYTCPNMWST